MANETGLTRNDGGQGDGRPWVQIVYDDATHTVSVNAGEANTLFYRTMCDMAKETLRTFELQEQLKQGPGIARVPPGLDLSKFRGH